ncbi:O-acyltransferase like protein [Bagarius yarrelli]|uniref:O-acyltransferase like protein n=1 Tax=Bagarius yarrelli TaxID=175774 RepID=A0A556V7U3_BAGYA|nr:O-acyltransferase like protein [Bagarius yarrelli]
MLQVKKTTALLVLCLFFCSWTIAYGFNISTRCAQDTTVFLTELKKNQPDEYAVLMYDALGKMGSDVKGGNMNRVGSLQECVSVQGPGFGGQYCQVFYKQGALDGFVGICVPDSCNEAEVSTLIVDGCVMSLLHSLSIRFSGVCFGDGVCFRKGYSSLNGVRVLSLFWIIYNSKRWRSAVESNPLYVVAFSGPVYLAVDTFLFLGGLLSAKSFLICIERSEDKLSVRLIAHFLLRRFKSNKHALVAVALILLLMSGVSSALITEHLQLPVHQPTTLDSKSYFEYYYNKPYTRYGPYALGIIAGVYLQTKKEDLIKQRWQAAAGWLVSLSAMAVIVVLAYVLRGQGSVSHAVYQGLHRSLWALAVAWVILACEEGHGGTS